MDYIKSLEDVVGYKIENLDLLKKALEERIEFFAKIGAKASDHALDTVVYKEASEQDVDNIFKKALNKEELSLDEIAAYKTNILLFLGKEYHKRDWVMQYHIGALRNVSTRMFKN